jgi:hypothetical protein
MSEFKVSVPRLKAEAMASDADMSIGIGEKGGVSIYVGGQRFPVTLYGDQWNRLLKPEVVTEIQEFIILHADLLAAGKPESTKAGKPEGGYTVNKADIELVAAEAAKLTEAGDIPGAIKYATIKSVAELGSKVTPEQMLEIMKLKVRG